MPQGILFDRTAIGTSIEGEFGYPMQNRSVRLILSGGAVSVKPLFGGDMFSHPHIGLAVDEEVEETQAFREFIDCLFLLKVGASPELRRYVLQLIYDDGFRQRFLQHPEEELVIAPLTDEEKQALRQAVDQLRAEVEAFKPGELVDDGDHIVLFPQTVEKIAPRAWFDAAWPFIAFFRSNFGFYLGEALLYSRVTIIGSMTSDPAVTNQQETFLRREVGPLVERIEITNADGLRQVLDWGKANNVRFGLGGEVTAMILASRPDDEIMAAIQDRFGPDEMERLAR